MEIVVDAYGPEEQALGWYYYLEDRLVSPFQAECIEKRRISPLRVGETVEVIGMGPEDDCMHEMFVAVRWSGRTMGVPLAQLKAVDRLQRIQPYIRTGKVEWKTLPEMYDAYVGL